MTETTEIPLDIRTYRLIVETATNVKNLTEAVDEIKTDVSALKDRFGDCPCEAVASLQRDMGGLKTDVTEVKTKVIVGVGILATVAGWVGSILPGLIGGFR